jgi:hypothetical protein
MSARWTSMRRFAVTMAAMGLLFVLAAAPAFAQRDPFEPLVSNEAGANVDDTGNAANGSSNDQTSNDSEPAPDTGSLPTTGSDMSGWLAAAYVLVAVGVGTVVVARMNGPEPRRLER